MQTGAMFQIKEEIDDEVIKIQPSIGQFAQLIKQEPGNFEQRTLPFSLPVERRPCFKYANVPTTKLALTGNCRNGCFCRQCRGDPFLKDEQFDEFNFADFEKELLQTAFQANFAASPPLAHYFPEPASRQREAGYASNEPAIPSGGPVSLSAPSSIRTSVIVQPTPKPPKFACPYANCEKVFKSYNSLYHHKRIHSRAFACTFPGCDRVFSQRGALAAHALTHTGERPHPCPVCGLAFRQKSHLTAHYRIHTDSRPYTCALCPAAFRQKTTLTFHLRTHTGEKPYSCDVCPKTFSQKLSLTYHSHIHANEKPYKCPICEVGFRQKAGLATHSLIHSDEKPHQCQFCSASFRQKSALTYHVRTHNGEKPYKCPYCPKALRSNSNLHAHLRTHRIDCHKCHTLVGH